MSRGTKDFYEIAIIRIEKQTLVVDSMAPTLTSIRIHHLFHLVHDFVLVGIVGLLLNIEWKLRDCLYPSIVSMAREYFSSGRSQNQLDVAGPKFETPVILQDEIHQTSRIFQEKSRLWFISLAAYWILIMNLHLE